MTDAAAPAIFVALEQSGFAAAIRQSPWLYPAANVGHIVFLALFAGAIAVMDVRLLGGLSATAPAPLLARTRNVALAALAGMAVTGSLLFSAEASHLALNPVFQLKALLVAAGLINVATYQFWARRAVEHLAPGAAMPARAKVTGAVSLASGSQSPPAGAALLISRRGEAACDREAIAHLPAPSAPSAGRTKGKPEERARQAREWRPASTMPPPLRLRHRDPPQCRSPMARAR